MARLGEFKRIPLSTVLLQWQIYSEPDLSGVGRVPNFYAAKRKLRRKIKEKDRSRRVWRKRSIALAKFKFEILDNLYRSDCFSSPIASTCGTNVFKEILRFRIIFFPISRSISLVHGNRFPSLYKSIPRLHHS